MFLLNTGGREPLSQAFKSGEEGGEPEGPAVGSPAGWLQSRVWEQDTPKQSPVLSAWTEAL